MGTEWDVDVSDAFDMIDAPRRIDALQSTRSQIDIWRLRQGSSPRSLDFVAMLWFSQS